MKGEIEVFEFLRAKSSIKGINIHDLQTLLIDAKKGKQFKNYSIKMSNQGHLLIYNTANNTNILLKCVRDHYKTETASCPKIRKELGLDTTEIDCAQCYVNYIEKLKNNEL